tara:strand:+ start:2454 stop:3011 length:558 start_codon:yes stop_codon:yes gene_type:complete
MIIINKIIIYIIKDNLISMPCVYGIFDNVKTNRGIDVYIGSTINFEKRMTGHKSESNNCASKKIIERNNYTMKILEESERWNDLTTRIKEQQYMNKYANHIKYNVINLKVAISILPPPPTREEIERREKETEKACQEWRNSCVYKAWIQSWNEDWMSFTFEGQLTCRDVPRDDNMLWIDYDVFLY